MFRPDDVQEGNLVVGAVIGDVDVVHIVRFRNGPREACDVDERLWGSIAAIPAVVADQLHLSKGRNRQHVQVILQPALFGFGL